MINIKSYKTIGVLLSVFAFLGIIYIFSGQNGEKSDEISKPVAGYLVSMMKLPEAIEFNNNRYFIYYNSIIRKIAHFILYFILAVIIYKILKAKLKTQILFPVIFLSCVFYGIFDEFHQSFIPGRSPCASDVIIDAFGSGIALICIYIFRRTRRSGIVK